MATAKPHEAKTLGEAALNPDGETYNGFKAMQWMYHAVTGKELSDEEAQEIGRKAKAIAEERRKNG